MGEDKLNHQSGRSGDHQSGSRVLTLVSAKKEPVARRSGEHGAAGSACLSRTITSLEVVC